MKSQGSKKKRERPEKANEVTTKKFIYVLRGGRLLEPAARTARKELKPSERRARF